MTKANPNPPRIDRGNLFLGIGLIAATALVVGAAVGLLFARQTEDHSTEMTDMVRAGNSGTVETLRQSVHEHADFVVFVNGNQLDLSDKEFLSTESDERSLNVHLHAPRTTVAHLHREQTTFDEFFTSLGMQLRDDCLTLASGEKFCNDDANALRFMVNGVRVDRLMFEKMTDMSRTLISYGPKDADLTAQWAAVTDQACIPGENCADRLPPGGLEKEPCAKSASMCH